MTEFSTPLSPDLRVSEETYLEMEKHAEERHEFFDGTIVEIVSADWKHDDIERLAAFTLLPSLEEYLILRPRLKQKGATAFRRHDGWEPQEIKAGGSIELRSIGLNLTLDNLYVP
ncbi:MAG: hypothetical protein ACKV19_10925 [Verrucomicrobiales bacterium]